jgi:hypothetical protein
MHEQTYIKVINTCLRASVLLEARFFLQVNKSMKHIIPSEANSRPVVTPVFFTLLTTDQY